MSIKEDLGSAIAQLEEIDDDDKPEAAAGVTP